MVVVAVVGGVLEGAALVGAAVAGVVGVVVLGASGVAGSVVLAGAVAPTVPGCSLLMGESAAGRRSTVVSAVELELGFCRAVGFGALLGDRSMNAIAGGASGRSSTNASAAGSPMRRSSTVVVGAVVVGAEVAGSDAGSARSMVVAWGRNTIDILRTTRPMINAEAATYGRRRVFTKELIDRCNGNVT